MPEAQVFGFCENLKKKTKTPNKDMNTFLFPVKLVSEK